MPGSRHAPAEGAPADEPGLRPHGALPDSPDAVRARWHAGLDGISAEERGATITPSHMIALQGLIGNARVTQLITRAAGRLTTHGAAPPVTVQRIEEKEKGALARRLRAAAIAASVGDKADWKLTPAAQDQYWTILQAEYPGGADGVAQASIDQAVTCLLEYFRKNPPQGRRSEAVVYKEGFEFAEPITLLSPQDAPIQPEQLHFDIPGVGVGRVALFRGVGEPSYGDVLAWFSHGVQVSEGSAEAAQAPAFAFAVPSNTKMVRPESAEGYRGLVEGAHEMANQGILGGGIPDMVVGHHASADFNPSMRRAVGEALLPRCSVAILYDFVRHQTITQEYDTAAGGVLGHQFLHLGDVVNALPGLREFKTWLMLCCRSLRSNIEAGTDRPEAYPKAQPFTEKEMPTPGAGGARTSK